MNATSDGEGDVVIARRARVKMVTDDPGDADRILSEMGMSGTARRIKSINAAVRTLAVAPFQPLDSDDADQYLGLGMADALITKLSNLRQIMVRPTSAVLKYAGQKLDPIEAGRELGVESILEGSIQKLHDRIRVSVQLVSVEDDIALWADRFDEKFTDIFAVQDSISQQVVEALTLKLSGEERKLLTKHHTEDTDAYQAYLRGRYFWNNLTDDTPLHLTLFR